MARIVLMLAVIGAGWIVANGGVALHEGLEDKLVLVALFPSIYILGLLLLRD